MASIRQISRQVSYGSAGDYQADEQAGVARLSSRVSSRCIERCLLLGRKVMTNLDSIFKSRDITLPTKVCLVKAMVFPVVIYGCESWTVKKAECR